MIAEPLVGRHTEKQILEETFQSASSELVAIYGRRRVGKTFLVRSVFANEIIFEFSGSHNAPYKVQLEDFSRQLTKISKSAVPLAVPSNWSNAFAMLETWLTSQIKEQKKVVFFDEFPWLDTARSNFLSAFSYFWNNWGVRQKNLLVVICGSAASWMIKNVVNNKGGLHNRITQSIRLLPFNLSETEAYLKSRTVNLDRYQVLQIYMAMGGIPFYLKNVRRGESAAQCIDRTCFTKDGPLRDEFDKLYSSLFDKADHHMKIVRALSRKGKGLTRNEIIQVCKLSSGGTATTILNELEESGFITSYIPFEKAAKDAIYKLADEYSSFFLKYIEGHRSTAANTWIRLSETSTWKSWSGIAFETICLKHIEQIKAGLGIAAVYTTQSVWRYTGGKDLPGAQIDLLIDRNDHSINICEMKYSDTEYTVTKSYAEDLKRKRDVFKRETKTKKTVFITMITTFGVTSNMHSTGNVDNNLTMDVLFSK
jgi:AAA+ ATPase superfamily predicted ATPase